MEMKASETIQALEEELTKKRAELTKLLEKVQEIPFHLTERIGKINDFEELKKIGDAIVEMENDVAKKREDIRNKLLDIQDDIAAFKELGEKVATEDVSADIQRLLVGVKQKKESLEEAIAGVDRLGEHYSKMFLG